MKIDSNYITLLATLIVSLSTIVRADQSVFIAEGSGATLDCAATDECYLPHTVVISEGESVVWTNSDSAGIHTITSGTVDGFSPTPDGLFDSGILNVGATYSVTFTNFPPGMYPYFCLLHTWMQGVVLVDPTPDHQVIVAVGSSTSGCEATDECYLPHSLVVSNGQSVIWTNQDTAAHSVTSGTTGSGPDGHFDSGLFSSGETFLFQFNNFAPGMYPYYCTVHTWMEGVVIVPSPRILP